MEHDDYQGAPPLENVDERQEALRRYHVLDTAPEKNFDQITRLAAQVCGVPTALITLIDRERQWFKSCFGYDRRETDVEVSFCAHAVHQQETLVIEDTLEDERFRDNPLVTGEPGWRFYAGAPLMAPEGVMIGTLCIVDYEPRVFDAAQRAILEDLADMVVGQFELRAAEAQYRKLFEGHPQPALVYDPDARELLDANAAAARTYGYPSEDALRGLALDEVVAPASLPDHLDAPGRASDAPFTARHLRRDGTPLSVEVRESGFLYKGRQARVATMIDAAERSRGRQYERLVENMQEVVFETDLSGKVSFINGAWEELLGIPAEDTLGEALLNYTHTKDRVATLQAFAPLLQRRLDLVRHRTRFRAADGREVLMQFRARLITGEHGTPVGTVGTLTPLDEEDLPVPKEKEPAEEEDPLDTAFAAPSPPPSGAEEATDVPEPAGEEPAGEEAPEADQDPAKGEAAKDETAKDVLGTGDAETEASPFAVPEEETEPETTEADEPGGDEVLGEAPPEESPSEGFVPGEPAPDGPEQVPAASQPFPDAEEPQHGAADDEAFTASGALADEPLPEGGASSGDAVVDELVADAPSEEPPSGEFASFTGEGAPPAPPADEAPTEEPPTEGTSAEETPAESTPVEEAPSTEDEQLWGAPDFADETREEGEAFRRDPFEEGQPEEEPAAAEPLEAEPPVAVPGEDSADAPAGEDVAPVADGPLRKIAYVSRARQPMEAHDLADLLGHVREQSKRLNVTGMLLYKQQTFLQVLEGPRDAVDRLYDTVGSDDRHHEAEVILDEDVDEREFADWGMGFRNLDEYEAEQYEGFSDFTDTEAALETFVHAPGNARQLLVHFRTDALPEADEAVRAVTEGEEAREEETLSQVQDRLGERPSRLRVSSIDFFDRMHRALERLEPSVRRKNLTLERDVPAGTEALIETDAGGVRLLLEALVSNATASTEEGGTVSVGASLDGGGGVRLRVEDDSPEASKGLLDSILSIGRSNAKEAPAPPDERYMSFVHRLVALLQGSIQMQSGRGSGTVFDISLPRAIEGLDTAEEAETAAPVGQSGDGLSSEATPGFDRDASALDDPEQADVPEADEATGGQDSVFAGLSPEALQSEEDRHDRETDSPQARWGEEAADPSAPEPDVPEEETPEPDVSEAGIFGVEDPPGSRADEPVTDEPATGEPEADDTPTLEDIFPGDQPASQPPPDEADTGEPAPEEQGASPFEEKEASGDPLAAYETPTPAEEEDASEQFGASESASEEPAAPPEVTDEEAIADVVAEGGFPALEAVEREAPFAGTETLADVRARLSADPPEVQAVELDFTEELRGALDHLEPAARRKGLTMRRTLPQQTVPIEADPGALRLLVAALVNNAITATDEGSVTVDARQQPSGGARLRVVDTGADISKSLLDSLLNVDAQDEDDEDEAERDMAFVHRLAALMQGTVEMESQRGSGTVFTIKLPRHAGTGEQNGTTPATTSEHGVNKTPEGSSNAPSGDAEDAASTTSWADGSDSIFSASPDESEDDTDSFRSDPDSPFSF